MPVVGAVQHKTSTLFSVIGRERSAYPFTIYAFREVERVGLSCEVELLASKPMSPPGRTGICRLRLLRFNESGNKTGIAIAFSFGGAVCPRNFFRMLSLANIHSSERVVSTRNQISTHVDRRELAYTAVNARAQIRARVKPDFGPHL